MLRRWKYLQTSAVATVDPIGSVRAVEYARKRLAEEQHRTGSVEEVSGRLKELQQRNHFAELLEMAMTPAARKPDGC